MKLRSCLFAAMMFFAMAIPTIVYSEGKVKDYPNTRELRLIYL